MSIARGTLLVVSLMASGAAYAGTPGWSVSEVSGPVFVGKPGLSKTSTVTRGAALAAGDIVSTGKGGRAVIVRGGEYLTVAPNTQLQLTEPKAGAFTQIVQSFGNVVFKIQKKTTPHFQVKTPYLAAVVKGTTFSVTVTPAGASVQVTEGLVQVASLDGRASRFVSPGEIGMIFASAPGRLSVLGTPNAPSGGAAVIGAAPVADAPSADAPAEPAAAPVSDVAEVRIASPIGEGSVNLSAQTGGIVSGNSSLAQAAIAEAVAVETPAAAEPLRPAEVSVAMAETPAPEAPAPVLETATNVLAEAPSSPPTTPTTSEVTAQAPVEVAVVTAPPVEQTPPPAEVAVAPTIEQAPPTVEVAAAPPVEVAALPPVEQASPPVEVAVATPVEPLSPPVFVAEAPMAPAPPVDAPPSVEVPVLVAVNTITAPVEQNAQPAPPAAEIAMNNANPNSVAANTSGIEKPNSDIGKGPENSSSDDSPKGGKGPDASESSGDKGNAPSTGTAVANDASGKKNSFAPTSLADLLKRIQIVAQQLAANRRGN
ncbi:MAG: hypothetical protein RIQ75_2428 [Pseudomonadota bacterium]